MSIIYHRGDTKISQENTLRAIISSNNLIEVDVQCDTIDLFMKHDDKNTIEKNGQTYISKSVKYLDTVLHYTSDTPVVKFGDLMKILSHCPNIKLCLDLKLKNEMDQDIIKKLVEIIKKHKNNIMYISSFNDDLLKTLRKMLDCVDFGLFMINKMNTLKKWIECIKPKYLIYSLSDVDKIVSPTEKPHKNIINVLYTIHIKDITDLRNKYSHIDYYIVDTF
jgi:glycerophosphoryl diester phosphodiesterase